MRKKNQPGCPCCGTSQQYQICIAASNVCPPGAPLPEAAWGTGVWSPAGVTLSLYSGTTLLFTGVTTPTKFSFCGPISIPGTYTVTATQVGLTPISYTFTVSNTSFPATITVGWSVAQRPIVVNVVNGLGLGAPSSVTVTGNGITYQAYYVDTFDIGPSTNYGYQCIMQTGITYTIAATVNGVTKTQQYTCYACDTSGDVFTGGPLVFP